jgi:hypothetical protein
MWPTGWRPRRYNTTQVARKKYETEKHVLTYFGRVAGAANDQMHGRQASKQLDHVDHNFAHSRLQIAQLLRRHLEEVDENGLGDLRLGHQRRTLHLAAAEVASQQDGRKCPVLGDAFHAQHRITVAVVQVVNRVPEEK